MIVSYNWLQKYFKEKLPSTKEVAELLTAHAFEVEETIEKDNDAIFDFKVWNDRAHYALSHRGVAYELSAILDRPFEVPHRALLPIKDTKALFVKVEDVEACPRYIGRRIDNIEVSESPTWLKEKLESIGQRSINSIVDAANFVMLDLGQPLHAFDADKVIGGITVRYGKTGEKITTLDNKEIDVDSSMLVIADDEGPLALAGIKGGKKAEVTKDTKHLILEAANFNASLIRKTSLKVSIKSDAAKRYENGITSEYAGQGMEEVTSLIHSLNPEAIIGEMHDEYSQKESKHIIIVSPHFINTALGIHLSIEDLASLLKRLMIEVEEKGNDLKLTIPFERLDLVVPEDIVEEVGRLYGYEKIIPESLKKIEKAPSVNTSFTYKERIRDILVGQGFSEVFTSSLSSSGDLSIENSASDKNFARTNLSENISRSLELNMHNAPILGLDRIRIFEIGNVFPRTGEHASLAIGIAHTKNWKGEAQNEAIRQVRELLLKELDAKMTTVCTIDDTGGILIIKGKAVGKINEIDGVMEINLDALLSILPDPVLGVEHPPESGRFRDGTPTIKYRPISSYPFVLRDIAVFVPGEKGNEKEVGNIIKKEGGELLVRIDLFDTFTKTFKETGEVKTSYGYRLVFQSAERTLTDEEINKIMEKITSHMNEKEGWKVR